MRRDLTMLNVEDDCDYLGMCSEARPRNDAIRTCKVTGVQTNLGEFCQNVNKMLNPKEYGSIDRLVACVMEALESNGLVTRNSNKMMWNSRVDIGDSFEVIYKSGIRFTLYSLRHDDPRTLTFGVRIKNGTKLLPIYSMQLESGIIGVFRYSRMSQDEKDNPPYPNMLRKIGITPFPVIPDVPVVPVVSVQYLPQSGGSSKARVRSGLTKNTTKKSSTNKTK